MNPLVSIIVPIYNVEEYLNKCLDSIINQTYKNLEIILVNDGSTDGCGNICDEYAKRDNRIKVIHKKNGGLSDARNAGMNIALGDYIGFIDSDDYVELDMYELLIKNIINTESDISICSCYYLYGDKPSIEGKIQNIFMEMDSEKAIKTMNTFGYYGVGVWDKLYKRSILNGIKFPIGELSEDWFVMFKILDRAKKIVYDSTPKYYYRQRNGSITHNKKVNYNPMYASKEALDFVKLKYPNIVESALTAYTFACVGVYNNIILYDKNKNIDEILSIVKKNFDDIIRNNDIPRNRRIQLKLLYYSPMLYNIMFKLFKKISK